MKCYSPEIIVHEALCAEDVGKWLGAIDTVVIGPGLGRKESLS